MKDNDLGLQPEQLNHLRELASKVCAQLEDPEDLRALMRYFVEVRTVPL